MDAEQLHPPPGEGPVPTADERRNIAGLDNVMNALEMSPLVKKLPARKNDFLHGLFPRRANCLVARGILLPEGWPHGGQDRACGVPASQ